MIAFNTLYSSLNRTGGKNFNMTMEKDEMEKPVVGIGEEV